MPKTLPSSSLLMKQDERDIKREVRKERNRIYARESRRKHKERLTYLEEENERLRHFIETHLTKNTNIKPSSSSLYSFPSLHFINLSSSSSSSPPSLLSPSVSHASFDSSNIIKIEPMLDNDNLYYIHDTTYNNNDDFIQNFTNHLSFCL